MPQKIYIITGTTAVGKTQFALDFAEQADAEIVSCDASLFYRGMDIGTAKPNAVEQARVPHHMLDLRQSISLTPSSLILRMRVRSLMPSFGADVRLW